MYKNDIREGILNFDMEDFFKPRTTVDSNGAILLITDKQIVLALNSDNGKGPHARAFAEAISEIYDIPIINGKTYEILNLAAKADNLISARLVNEGEAGTYFAFLLGNVKSISENEFKTFERFYHQYNSIIKKISKQYQFPIINCIVPNYDNTIKNKFGIIAKTITISSNDLTPVLNSLEKIVDSNKKNLENKKIVELSDLEKSQIYIDVIINNLNNLKKYLKDFQKTYKNNIVFNIYDKKIKELENNILIENKSKFTLLKTKEVLFDIACLKKDMADDIIKNINSYKNKEPSNKGIKN